MISAYSDNRRYKCLQGVRPCVSPQGPDVVIFTSARITDVQFISGSEDGVEESVANANGAVGICEVDDQTRTGVARQ